LKEHLILIEEAKKAGVVVMVEHHKRFDPAYTDARNKALNMGEFNYFYSYMSQPKYQLDTFRSWAGKESDISYYLNSHHIDFHCWTLEGKAVPYRVYATGSKGVATSEPYSLKAGTELKKKKKKKKKKGVFYRVLVSVCILITVFYIGHHYFDSQLAFIGKPQP
jgi:D-galacturonate reductase